MKSIRWHDGLRKYVYWSLGLRLNFLLNALFSLRTKPRRSLNKRFYWPKWLKLFLYLARIILLSQQAYNCLNPNTLFGLYLCHCRGFISLDFQKVGLYALTPSCPNELCWLPFQFSPALVANEISDLSTKKQDTVEYRRIERNRIAYSDFIRHQPIMAKVLISKTYA